MLSTNILGKTQRKRKHCYEHSSLNLWGINAGDWGLSPKETLNQTLSPRAGCITLVCGPHFHTTEGALPLSWKIFIISSLAILGSHRAMEEFVSLFPLAKAVSQTKAVMGPSTEYGISSRMYLGLQSSTGRVISVQDKLIRVSPLHTNEFLSKSASVNPICS